jgi:hypothetical protein
VHKPDGRSTRPPTATLHVEGLFVPRSGSGDRNDENDSILHDVLHEFAGLAVRHGGGGLPTD